MGYLENFKRQHREIKELVEHILPMLNQDLLKREPAKIRSTISILTGKLMMHLAMEDHFLYPSLRERNDQRLQTIGEKFFAETSDLMVVFKSYSQKWLNPGSIKENPDSFIRESEELFHLLLRRIDEEDRHLYPLFEKAG